MLPGFLTCIGRKFPGVELQVRSGSTSEIIRGLEEDPTASRDDIIDIARSLARPGS
ncbi:hypothetical protein N185_32710 [Sinorhizobium sp. GW3]|nr:hypothetical protein N185_32710 [Sinorhizobium sp. GW3]